MIKELRTYRFDSKTIGLIEKLALDIGIDRTEVIKRAVNTFCKLYGNNNKRSFSEKSAEKSNVNTLKLNKNKGGFSV